MISKSQGCARSLIVWWIEHHAPNGEQGNPRCGRFTTTAPISHQKHIARVHITLRSAIIAYHIPDMKRRDFGCECHGGPDGRLARGVGRSQATAFRTKLARQILTGDLISTCPIKTLQHHSLMYTISQPDLHHMQPLRRDRNIPPMDHPRTMRTNVVRGLPAEVHRAHRHSS